MSCNYPLIVGQKYGSDKWEILGASTIDSCIVFRKKFNPYYKSIIPVPCGRCAGCRMDYSRDWADRCCLEVMAGDLKSSYFLTLTYDDGHIPPNGSVEYYDVQLFLKRLRKRVGSFRYFGASEYGDTTFRPHYHIILFDINLSDLKYFNTKGGEPYYTSETISNSWCKGNHLLTSFNFSTAAYVARYVFKKQKGEGSQLYTDLGIDPPGSFMSLKPGIGAPYFDEHSEEIMDTGRILLPYPIAKKPRFIAPPKYFQKLIADRFPERWEAIKQDLVHKSNILTDSKFQNSSYLDFSSQLADEDEALQRSLLPRLL